MTYRFIPHNWKELYDSKTNSTYFIKEDMYTFLSSLHTTIQYLRLDKRERSFYKIIHNI